MSSDPLKDLNFDKLEEIFYSTSINTNFNVLQFLQCPKCGWKHPDDDMADVIFVYDKDMCCTEITFTCKSCKQRQTVKYPYEAKKSVSNYEL